MLALNSLQLTGSAGRSTPNKCNRVRWARVTKQNDEPHKPTEPELKPEVKLKLKPEVKPELELSVEAKFRSAQTSTGEPSFNSSRVQFGGRSRLAPFSAPPTPTASIRAFGAGDRAGDLAAIDEVGGSFELLERFELLARLARLELADWARPSDRATDIKRARSNR